MINKLMTGRLGNQMFQYATMRGLQEKYNIDEKFNMNFSHVRKSGTKEEGYINQLENFKLNDEKYEIDKKIKLSIWQSLLLGIYFVTYKIIKIFSNPDKYYINKQKYENKIQRFYNKNGLYLYNFGYYDFKSFKSKNKLFIGYFEAHRYFDDIKVQLREEFTPKYDKIDKNLELYDIIENTESVCISIRRGDFLDNPEKYYVCKPEYFYKAIEIIEKKVKKPKFIVFSDDIKWVKENMKLPEGTEYETGEDPVWEKLRLMYSCKHFIISNSTFSWWAQYLSINNNKVVIAPNKWRGYGYDSKDIYMKDWILIDVDNIS